MIKVFREELLFKELYLTGIHHPWSTAQWGGSRSCMILSPFPIPSLHHNPQDFSHLGQHFQLSPGPPLQPRGRKTVKLRGLDLVFPPWRGSTSFSSAVTMQAWLSRSVCSTSKHERVTTTQKHQNESATTFGRSSWKQLKRLWEQNPAFCSWLFSAKKACAHTSPWKAGYSPCLRLGLNA